MQALAPIAGMKVRVYQRPLTDEDYEGVGILEEVLAVDGEYIDCMVRMEDEMIVRRRVHPRNFYKYL